MVLSSGTYSVLSSFRPWAKDIGVMEYNATSGYLGALCQGVPLSNYDVQQIWYKAGYWGKGEA